MNVDMTMGANKMHIEHAYKHDMNSPSLISSIIAVLFLSLVASGVYYLTRSDTLPIKHVRVNGDFSHLSPVDLQLLVDNEVRGGFFSLDVDAVRVTLLSEPWVNDVTVKRIWPDAIHVTVTEQIPAALWKDNGLLNVNGQYFEPEKKTFSIELPMLSGPEGSEQELLNRYNFMNQKVNSIGYEINSLILDDRRAYSFDLTNGVQVILGRKDFSDRFSRFLLFVPTLLKEHANKIALVDMRYTNGLSIKWKNKIDNSAIK